MGALDLAAEVIVQPRKVDVKVVELRLVVHKDAELVGIDAIGLAYRLGANL